VNPAHLRSELPRRYRSGQVSAEQVLRDVVEQIATNGSDGVWIDRVAPEEVLGAARRLSETDPERRLPLHGLPFAVKDNIDVAGQVTTAGCPPFGYVAERSATVVERLQRAGAILVGKTNLDQFATGLVGVRTPYPIPRNPFHADYVPGGSSSGSAVAVARGLVSFALGTDTAGSGRVPAAFNNIVGVKPTRGLVSTRGVVPACASLDCVSIFAPTVAEAFEVLVCAAGPDPGDPFSRVPPPGFHATPWPAPDGFTFGVPRREQWQFFGNREAERRYEATLGRAEACGGHAAEVDLTPFFEAGQLLYEGPWVAERTAAVGPFLEKNPGAGHPVVRSIIIGGNRFSAVDAFRAQYRLRALQSRVSALWTALDCLLLPTAGTIYRIADVQADPVRLNAHLGHYTNAVNLLDLCAIAVPAGFQAEGLPFGVSLIAPAWQEPRVAPLAAALHRAVFSDTGSRLGAVPASASELEQVAPSLPDACLMVFGAHMRGLPLNGELTALGATFMRACRTEAAYRLYALPGSPPPRPGVVRMAEGGTRIEGEVWHLPPAAWGAFLARVPPPLVIGTVRLDDGATVKGFLCEAHATAGAPDISGLGGWRAYRAG